MQDLVTGLELPDEQVWVQPQGKTAVDVIACLRDVLMPMLMSSPHEYRVSTRLHVLAYDDRRAI